MKKIITKLILISLVIPQISWAVVSPVTFDPTNFATNAASTAQETLTATQQILLTVKETVLDGLAFQLAQTTGAKLANKVFNKANGGASGDDSQPSYVQDFNNYFADLDRSKLQKYITDLEVSKNPFAKNIAQSMIFAYSTAGGPGVPDDIGGFNLDTMLGPNYQRFYDDASVGGYDGFLAMTIPGNTAIGAQMIAEEKLGRAIEDAREAERLKLTSPGILPQQGQCTMDIKQYIQNTRSTAKSVADFNEVNNSGEGDSRVLAEARAKIKELEDDIKIREDDIQDYNEQLKNTTDPIKVDMIGTEIGFLKNEINGLSDELRDVKALQNEIADMGLLAANNINALREDFGRCLVEAIKNPLSLVSSGLQQATGYAMESLKEQDEIVEVLGGLFITMFNSFLQNGLSSLRADFSSSGNTGAGSIGGPEDLRTTNGQTINWTNTPQTIVDLKADFNKAYKDTKEDLDWIQNYFNLISGVQNNSNEISFPQIITNLDVCIPGPDYEYDKKLDDYFNVKTSRLQRKMNMGTEKKQETRGEAMGVLDEALDNAKTDLELWMITPTRNMPGATYMKSEIENLSQIKGSYTKKRGDIKSRQYAFTVLMDIEARIKSSLNRLPEGTIPQGIRLIAPFSEESWKKLTEVEKDMLINWVKGKIQTTQEITLDSSEQKFAFVTNMLWDIWENPAGYISSENIADWDYRRGVASTQIIGPNNETETTYISKAQDFINEKNKIRSDFHALSDKVSNTALVNQSKAEFAQLATVMDTIKKLYSDCMTMRSIVNNNSHLRNDPQGHEKMRQILKNSKNSFATDAIKNSFDGPSILNTVPTEFPEGMKCSNNTCSLVTPLDFDTEDTNFGSAEKNYYSNYGSQYQKAPAKNIWEVFEQDRGIQSMSGEFLCPFVNYFNIYNDQNPVKGKDMSCADSKDWYRTSPSVFQNFLFKNIY